MSKFVAIACDGVVQVHAGPQEGSPYASLCGLDGNDDAVGQAPAPLPMTPKIDCPDCRSLIVAARRYRTRDLA